jgi:superfamily I DNA/RNA helicase
MISVNPNRIPKNLVSLYQNADPAVGGTLRVWSFPSEQDEARAIAESCQQLINAGIAGQEDEILILISDRGLQLQLIAQELGNLGLPYDPPPGEALTDVDPIRAVYSALRIARDVATGEPDYVAHRALLGLLSRVGPGTARAIADTCVTKNQNFNDLFYLAAPPPWLPTRSANAVTRVMAMIQTLHTWSLADTLTNRTGDIAQLLATVFQGSAQAVSHVATWNALAAALPDAMTLEELLGFFEADNDADRRSILDSVNQRLGPVQPAAPAQQRRIRILTMHGAKGLSGKVVFIPSLEQGIMPSFRALQAAGLVIEQRRLFYVSVTRAMATCIITHAAQHTGPSALRLQQRPTVMLPRSQYLNEMNVPSVNRNGGLTPAEAAQIVADVGNL